MIPFLHGRPPSYNLLPIFPNTNNNNWKKFLISRLRSINQRHGLRKKKKKKDATWLRKQGEEVGSVELWPDIPVEVGVQEVIHEESGWRRLQRDTD